MHMHCHETQTKPQPPGAVNRDVSSQSDTGAGVNRYTRMRLLFGDAWMRNVSRLSLRAQNRSNIPWDVRFHSAWREEKNADLECCYCFMLGCLGMRNEECFVSSQYQSAETRELFLSNRIYSFTKQRAVFKSFIVAVKKYLICKFRCQEAGGCLRSRPRVNLHELILNSKTIFF